jgi:transglutaminase-like putative cysteine protease
MYSAKKIFSVCFILSLFLTDFNYTQDFPIEWKKIPQEDLKMTSYAADTSASALILCDFGFTSFNDYLELVFTRHMRVKIFNDNAYDFATHIITLSAEDEYIDDIEGFTYWLDDNGKMAKSELDEDDILKEKITSAYVQHKFTMPALRPGCIVDIRYKIITKSVWAVRDWIFQYTEPVRWSEYRLMYLNNLAYSAVTRGYEGFYINEAIQTTRVVSGTALSYTKNSIANCNILRWVVKDAPAVREEAYSTCPEDYMNKVEIQFSGYAIPGQGVKTFNNDWKTFVKDEHEGKWFGKKISTSGKVKTVANTVTAGIHDNEEKIKAIYNWVTRSITWSGANTRYPQKDMDYVLEQKKGNSADINLLLVSLLKSAGLECYPLILSTRSNGKIQDLYPIDNQFNYVIAKVSDGSKNYYLDATDPLRPYDLLPQKVLYVKAIAIKEGPVEWVTLGCEKKNTTYNIAWLRVDEEGSINGYFENSLGEYVSLSIRKELVSGNERDIIKKYLETEMYGFEIDSIVISNKDSIHLPLKITTYVTSDQYAQVSGDMIYLNPNFVFRIKENPFKAEQRKFPVDYGYYRTFNTIITILFPEGYDVRESIKNKNLYAGASNINYSRKTALEHNQLQLVCKFDIREIEVKPVLYEKLREFYSRLLSTQSEQIVLARKI